MTAPIAFRDRETIAFLGDSITEQNLYTAFIETFLRSRLPGHELEFHNFGWGGDTAPGGAGRYARDVLPVKPDLVLVKFGMNDGAYVPPDEAIRARYLAGQRALADAIAAGGARQVLISPNAVDPHEGMSHLQQYNPALALFAEHLAALAAERGIPFIDFFAPFLAVQEQAKAADPAFTMVPDGVHPLEVGHLVMAYVALKRFAVPAGLGDVTVTAAGVRAEGPATVVAVAMAKGGVSFDLHLPFLPFFVPEAARPALDLVPLQQELNRFRLDCSQWGGEKSLLLSIDGVEVLTILPGDRAKPIDLARLDAAPWAQRGRLLWSLARARFTAHLQAWRELGVSAAPGLRAMPDLAQVAEPLRALARDLGRQLRRLTAPGTWRITVAESPALPIARAEVSPIYPFAPGEPASFAQAHPPETAAGGVAWRTVAVQDHAINLGAVFGQPLNCVCYVRLVLDAAKPARLRLVLGSDDGITVLHDGRVLLARNVMRGCKLGDDQVELTLAAGRNTLLLRVTQGGGGYAVAFRADLLDEVDVRQVIAG